MQLNEWLSINKMDGEGNAELTLTASSNEEFEARLAMLKIIGIDVEKYVSVEQKAYSLDGNFWIEFEETGAELSGLGDSAASFTYSFDGVTWNNTSSKITMGTNKKVYLRNSTKALGGTNFEFSKKAKVGGDLSYIVDMSEKCCDHLFFDSKITDASALILPWETLELGCFMYMFSASKYLVYPPVIKAQKLAQACYMGMFMNCSSLVRMPQLLKLNDDIIPFGACSQMFRGCTSLTEVCDLEAKIVYSDGYFEMFCDCTSLVVAPKIEAEILRVTEGYEDTYSSGQMNCMFLRCNKLTTPPPILKAVTKRACYWHMFAECSSLRTAPVLPSNYLAPKCYQGMFYKCYSLTYIKMLGEGDYSQSSSDGDEPLNWWVYDINTQGIFVKHPSSTIGSDTTLGYGIPNGWTVYDDGDPYIPEPSDKNNEYLWVEFESSEGAIKGLNSNFSYSYDCDTWNTCGSSLTVPAQTTVYFKNDTKNLTGVSIGFSQYAKIGGDLSSIGDMKANGFAELFYKYDTKLTDASDLILPWDEVSEEAFKNMFCDCAYLKYGPQLPATVLDEKAYYGMFSGCASLIIAPSLPATILGLGCYAYMFEDCSSLTSLPTIIASDLCGQGSSNSPAWNMFKNCSGLEEITVPSNLTKLATDMFYGCSNLKTIYCYAQDAPIIESDTFYGVSTNGVLYTPQGSDYSSWLSTSYAYLGYYGWTGSPTL